MCVFLSQYEINLLDLIEKRRAVSRFSESWKKYSINMTLELGFGKQLALIIVWWCAHNDIFLTICFLCQHRLKIKWDC